MILFGNTLLRHDRPASDAPGHITDLVGPQGGRWRRLGVSETPQTVHEVTENPESLAGRPIDPQQLVTKKDHFSDIGKKDPIWRSTPRGGP